MFLEIFRFLWCDGENLGYNKNKNKIIKKEKKRKKIIIS
jgi:hypothetical protein